MKRVTRHSYTIERSFANCHRYRPSRAFGRLPSLILVIEIHRTGKRKGKKEEMNLLESSGSARPLIITICTIYETFSSGTRVTSSSLSIRTCSQNLTPPPLPPHQPPFINLQMYSACTLFTANAVMRL